ncbi:MAG: 4Fe-4S binding protein [Thiogranum sp.]
MTNGGEPDLLSRLSSATGNGLARNAACAAAALTECQPAAAVSYQSAGTLLIVGAEAGVLAAAEILQGCGNLTCTLLVPEPGQSGGTESTSTTLLRGKVTTLAGHLGRFRVQLESPAATAALQVATGKTEGHFDLVLDLSSPPLLGSEILPPGYYAPPDAAALQQALQELPTLVGEFEKPRYFRYNASICAHGRSAITACTRCLDSCPTDAIISIGDSIQVDPELCQGAGSCATVCPTGAISYGYPQLGDTLQRLRTLLKTYRQEGGTEAVLLLHDAEDGRRRLEAVAQQLPENVIPFEIEELGSAGMDTWLAALAYGASALWLLATPGLPASVMTAIVTQLNIARTILEGLGYPADVLQISGQDSEALLQLLNSRLAEFAPAHAEFAALDEKRTVIRLAVDHLYEQAPAPRPLVSLPAGSPFGEVEVSAERCTLCMACVSQCPANALSAGDEKPQLKFIEANCVQCGLCCRSCPEDAIAASPRFLYDAVRRSRMRVLNEEEPFCCIRCGKAFATRSVIERITQKMKGHPLFSGDALARISMCDDCRVKAIYEDEQAGHAGISTGDSK